MNNYSPIDYMRIDIANHYGLDKLHFEDRIAWVKKYENNLEAMASDIVKPKKQARYMSALLNYRAVQSGKPTGHLVGLDASASGIGLLSVVMGCETGCRNVGIIGDSPQDIYTNCYVEMNEVLEGKHIERDSFKKAMMTSFYGSVSKPKEIFPNRKVRNTFYAIADKMAPGASELKDVLLLDDIWQAQGGKSHSWVMPDGFQVYKPVLAKIGTKIEVDELDHITMSTIYEDNIATDSGLCLAADITHAIDSFVCREVIRRCSYDIKHMFKIRDIIINSLDTEKTSGGINIFEYWASKYNFLSLEVINSIDESNIHIMSINFRKAILELIESLLSRPSFDAVSVHS